MFLFSHFVVEIRRSDDAENLSFLILRGDYTDFWLDLLRTILFPDRIQ